MRKGRYSIILITFLFITILGMAGASLSCSGVKYRQATVTNGKITYSFEYPTYYTDPQGTLDGHMGSADSPFVSLRFTNPDDPESQIENELAVDTVAHGIGAYSSYDAQMKAADEIKLLEIPELEGLLLEQSKTTVYGIQAEYIVYTAIVASAGGPSSFPNPAYQIHVYFDYQGVIWHIGIIAEPEFADREKEEFDRIIKSFKFLS